MVQNNTQFDARYNTYDDLQSIRCPFQRQRKSVYLVKVEKEYKSGITAAIPALAPPNKVRARIRCLINISCEILCVKAF